MFWCRTARSRIHGSGNLVKRLYGSETRQAEEIRIPVPYGHIAGKAWGNPNGKPILGLHGWLDNSATHDGLAAFIPPEYRFICIDQPGHGLSSHYPPGMHYKLSDAFTFLQRVLDHLQWDTCTILGHSLGGGMASWYAALFPEKVEKVISIDLISFGSMSLQKHVTASRKSVLSSVKIHEKLARPQIPVYTFEDACGQAFMANNIINGMGSITQKSVETLMTRGLVKTADGRGYTWTADLRLRIPTAFNMTQDLVEEYASKITSPHLLIKATDSIKYMSDENFGRILKVYQNNNPNFVYREVAGGHHLHLNTPELVAPAILEFLAKDFRVTDPDPVPYDMI